ncbi:MAG TPA: hypothetical protein VFE63_04050 [Roseiarcus sp.]|jgi:hypothetical protein|nr:hypothetical protein [Roseiarcus sp.]
MSFEEKQLILCGRCRRPVELSAPSGQATIVSCPTCGQSDTLEEARREAAQHTAHRVLSAMLSGLRAKDQPELYFRFVESGDRQADSRGEA